MTFFFAVVLQLGVFHHSMYALIYIGQQEAMFLRLVSSSESFVFFASIAISHLLVYFLSVFLHRQLR